MTCGIRSGPDRAAMSGVVAGATFLGGVAAAMALADTPYPRPGSDAETVRRYFRGSPRAARLSAVGQLASAAALGRFTVSVARLAGRSGPGAHPLQAAAVAGGAVAVASLATSAALSAALTTARADSDEVALRLHRTAFLAGGIAHGAGFGALVGSLAASGLRTGELPRPLATVGLGSAAAGLLSPLYLLAPPAAWLIPAGRFSGLLVTGISAVRLARGLGRVPERRP
jgi:hypothetical protein